MVCLLIKFESESALRRIRDEAGVRIEIANSGEQRTHFQFSTPPRSDPILDPASFFLTPESHSDILHKF
jgi:hypothetical protein